MALTAEQIADGWIEHDGGECPVPRDALVKVRFRNGDEQSGRACWFDGGISYKPSDWNWQKSRSQHNSWIIAYRKAPTS